jgi:hypothetical protein
MNWLASKHNLKMAGRSFGWKKNYGLTVTVSSEPWCLASFLPVSPPEFFLTGPSISKYVEYHLRN